MLTAAEKKSGYELVLLQLVGLLEMEQDKIASLGNASAVLAGFLPDTVFSGFYLYNGEELTLAPFQGNVSCTRIKLGKGVCGQSATENKTLIVPDVTKHANYIACDSAARSEIVVPMYKDGALLGVLDLDASVVDAYDELDQAYLEKFAALLVKNIQW